MTDKIRMWLRKNIMDLIAFSPFITMIIIMLIMVSIK